MGQCGSNGKRSGKIQRIDLTNDLDEDEDMDFKYVITGDCGVGKTSLLLRFIGMYLYSWFVGCWVLMVCGLVGLFLVFLEVVFSLVVVFGFG